MKKWIVWMLALTLWLNAAKVRESVWKSGETFSEYLDRYGISQELLRSISPEDSKYLFEIQGGEPFYELMEGDRLVEALIPIGEEMQIQLMRDLKSGRYRFDIVPISYREVEDEVLVEIRHNCSTDIARQTHNPRLGFLLKGLYKGAVDFRKLRAGDKVAFRYRQKSRLGEPWGQPRIEAAVVETRGKRHFVFVDKEGNAWRDLFKKVRYTQRGKKIVEVLDTRVVRVRKPGRSFVFPVPGARITSRFSYKRWHPILHRYRPHLGVDWGARRGTPIHAVSGGRVIYAGWMRGYGKVVKIDHGGGYVSLYAHQSRIRVKRGSYVKRGQVIGYVGSTGRSTGPHLHLGIYRNGRAIDPLKVLGRGAPAGYGTKKVVTRRKELREYTLVKTRKVRIEGAQRAKKRLKRLLEQGRPRAYRWEEIERNFVRLERDDAKKEKEPEHG